VLALDAGGGPGRHVLQRGVDAGQRGQHGGPAQEQVGVVLPGEPDAAVHLDVHPGVHQVGLHGHGGGHGGGQVGLLRGARAGGVPGSGDGELAAHQHVGQVVLDRLEAADDPAELLADLGVGQRHVQRGPGPARGLGGGQRAQQPGGRAGRTGQPLPLAGDLHGGQPEGGVEAVDGGHGDRVGRQHQHVVAVHDQVQLRPHRPDRRATHGQRRRGAAVHQTRQQRSLLVGRAALGDQRRGRHRGQHRSAGHLPAQPLQHHRQLGQAEAGAAVVLGDVQPQPALPGDLLPDRVRLGAGFGRGLHGAPGRRPRSLLDRELPHHPAQVGVFLGDRQRHVGHPLPRRPRSCREEYPDSG
jgi:hypothetical protein